MSLPERLKNPGMVLQFLDSQDGKEITDYFKEMVEKSVRALRRSNELKEIFYAQGAVDAAERMANLKKDIQEFLKRPKPEPPKEKV